MAEPAYNNERIGALETLPAAILPLVVPTNVSAVLVLFPVSTASVVVGVGRPTVGVVEEPELLESVVDDVVFGEESALEAAPDPQPVSQIPRTKIAAAFPITHKRKSRLLAGSADRGSQY